MHVAFVHWTLPPTVGGVETHLVDLAAALVAAGATVTILSGTREPDLSLLRDRVNQVYVPLLDMMIRTGIDYDGRRELSVLKRVIQQMDPDVVHVHNLFPLAGRILAQALEDVAATTGAALFHTFHSEWRPRPGVLDPARWSGFITVSSFLRDRYRLQGLDPLVARLPVDSDRFFGSTAVSFSRPARLLHPARLAEEKGQLVSVKAVEELHRRGIDVVLTLTTTPDVFRANPRHQRYRERLQSTVIELGLEAKTAFTTPAINAMPGLYEESDIVLYPSLFSEPAGLAPLEAMSMRRPVVVTAVGGLPEVVEHGVTGLLVQPANPLDLADAVGNLVSEGADSRALRQAAGQYVRDEHSMPEFSNWLLALYDRALRSTSCPLSTT